jgi:hypothetical protein
MTYGKNSQMAEEAFTKFSYAVKQGEIQLQPCVHHDEICVYADSPESKPRFTYAILSPENPKEVMAMVVIVLDGIYADKKTTWSITWAVAKEHRNIMMGSYIAGISLHEFVTNAGGKLGDFAIEAVVDIENLGSRKISQKLLGNEKIVKNADGTEVYSYMKIFKS